MKEHLTSKPVRVALYAAMIFTLVLVNLPLMVVVPASFGGKSYLQFPPQDLTASWYGAFARDPSWRSSIGNSVVVASGTTMLACLLGTMAALGLQRMRARASEAVLAALLVPLIVPHVALAIGLYPMFARIHIIDTRLAVILAHVVVSTPLVVIVVSSALRNVDPNLEKAAMSLAASPVRTFWEVTLPLIMPAIVGGAILAFIASFDELELALFMSGPATRTLPLQLWEQVQYGLGPVIAVASSVIVLGLTALLLLLIFSQRRFRKSADMAMSPGSVAASTRGVR